MLGGGGGGGWRMTGRGGWTTAEDGLRAQMREGRVQERRTTEQKEFEDRPKKKQETRLRRLVEV